MKATHWRVRWCYEVPTQTYTMSDGTVLEDNDIDNAKFRSRVFTDEQKARAFAAEMLSEDWFGQVELIPFAEITWRQYEHDMDLDSWIEKGRAYAEAGEREWITDDAD